MKKIHIEILPECIEKFNRISDDIREIKNQISNHIPTQIKELDIKIGNLPEEIEKRFVSQDQFKPVQKIVYGLVGVVLTSVMVALVALILK